MPPRQFGQPPAQSAPGGRMLLPSVTVKGLRLVNPSDRGQEIRQEESIKNSADLAKERAQLQTSQGQVSDFLKNVTEMGKSYEELTFNDILNATDKNIPLANQILKLRDSFKSTQGESDKTVVAAKVIDSLFSLADSIPASEGISGRVQSFYNKGAAQAGYLPQLKVLKDNSMLVAPLLRKAIGDTGNISNAEQIAAMAGLESLGAGTKAERQLQKEFFINLLERASGKKWNQMVGKKETPKDSIKERSTEELLQMLINK